MSGNSPTPRTNMLDLVPGTMVGGYRIESRLGGGAIGAVYRAFEPQLGRTVALKVLPRQVPWDARFRERFERESRAASALEHPNIVPVYSSGEDGGLLHLTMRYVPGGDLDGLLRQAGPLSAELAMGVLAPVAAALEAAHRAGIVHRGVKPTDILVDRVVDGSIHPYLSGFGLAPQSGLPGSSPAGGLLGPGGYAAPEQLEGHRAGPAADQYALACVAYQVLTGRVPFRGDTAQAQLTARATGIPRVTSLRGDLPAAVDDVIGTALSWEPEYRYASCRDLATHLGQALGGGARKIAALHLGDAAGTKRSERRGRRPKPPRETSAGRPRRARGLVMPLVGVLGIVAVVGIAAAVLPWLRTPAHQGDPHTAPAATGPVRLAHTLHVPGGRPATAVGFDTEQDTVITLDGSRRLTSFDAGTGLRRGQVRLHTGTGLRTQDARFSRTRPTVVVPESACGGDGTASCDYLTFDTPTGKPGQPVPGGTGPAFSLGGPLMAVVDAAHDGVDTWRPDSHDLQDPGLGRDRLKQRQARAAALDPTGKALAVATTSPHGAQLLWLTDIVHADDGTSPRTVATIPTGTSASRIALSGRTLAAGGATRTDLFRTMPDHPKQRVHARLEGGLLALSPEDGDLVATLSPGGDKVSLWDVSTMLPDRQEKGEQTDRTVTLRRTATMTCGGAMPTTADFGPDGRTLAVGCSDGKVAVWEIRQ